MTTPILYVHPLAERQLRGTAVGTILREQTGRSQLLEAITEGIKTTEAQP